MVADHLHPGSAQPQATGSRSNLIQKREPIEKPYFSNWSMGIDRLEEFVEFLVGNKESRYVFLFSSFRFRTKSTERPDASEDGLMKTDTRAKLKCT